MPENNVLIQVHSNRMRVEVTDPFPPSLTFAIQVDIPPEWTAEMCMQLGRSLQGQTYEAIKTGNPTLPPGIVLEPEVRERIDAANAEARRGSGDPLATECERCKGTGLAISGIGKGTCPTCLGSGRVVKPTMGMATSREKEQ